jgi:DNA-binding GntR family transcriptional regulator
MVTNISPSISPSNEQEPKAAKKIHQVLKEEILNGIIEPGTLLSESKLASRFGVSRTPIREALSMLDNDRLIFSLPQRGHQVRTVSFSETVDAFRIRELLEVEAIRLAVHRIKEYPISSS